MGTSTTLKSVDRCHDDRPIPRNTTHPCNKAESWGDYHVIDPACVKVPRGVFHVSLITLCCCLALIAVMAGKHYNPYSSYSLVTPFGLLIGFMNQSIAFLGSTVYFCMKDALRTGTGCKYHRLFSVPMVDWCVDKAVLTSSWLRGGCRLLLRTGRRTGEPTCLMEKQGEDVEAQMSEML